jgi:hypothetical protein
MLSRITGRLTETNKISENAVKRKPNFEEYPFRDYPKIIDHLLAS